MCTLENQYAVENPSQITSALAEIGESTAPRKVEVCMVEFAPLTSSYTYTYSIPFWICMNK